MPVQPDHLLTFARVAELGSVSAAARALHLSQPAASAQLAQLARAVGEPLVRRHRYGVHLTAAGETLLPHALAVRRALLAAREHAAELRDLRAGSVSVAASNTVAAHVLPAALSAFHVRFPKVALRVRQGNTREVLALLGAAQCELALVEGPTPALPPELEVEAFREDTLLLVVPPDHPLADQTCVMPGELADLGVVWREEGSGTREVAQDALRRANVAVREVLELAGAEAVKEAVLSGLGAAFLSELSVRRELNSGALARVQVELPGLSRTFRIVRPRRELLSRAAGALLDELNAAPQA